MIVIDDCVISDDIINEKFCCHLDKCKGICCVLGDAGAPLLAEELDILDDIFLDVKPYLRDDGVKAISTIGTYDIDTDGEYVTPLIRGKECAYAIFDEKEIARCAIEKAYTDGKINFRKPLSCHLYPIRITPHKSFNAVNYHRWDVCKDARALGLQKHISLLEFLEEPLVRKYGKEWYKALCMLKHKK